MMKSHKLSDYEPFNQLPQDVAESIEAASESITYPADTIIFTQNDDPTGFLYFIQNGSVEIISETSEGVELIVDHRDTGEFFGWTPIFTHEGYTAGARTAENSTCLLISENELNKISGNHPAISKYFNRAIYSRIKKLYKDMVGQHSMDPVAQMEAYPFQKKLSEIMTKPVATCDENSTVREIAFKMTELGVAALLVVNNYGKMIGIVTERDLVKKVLAKDTEECLKTSNAVDIMTPDPFYMTSETYMYEAATFMLTHNIRHLPVLEGDSVVGIVTQQDLMKFRSQKSMLLVGHANEATSINELRIIHDEIVNVARVLLIENRSHVETMEILSYIHHNVIRRCYEIIMDSMERDGYKKPDIKFCFIIMGSGGRKEMLLGPDQDNGFIFEDFPDEMQQEVDAYFIPFADRLVTALAELGYPLCNGKVMVNNPQWRGRLQEWKDRVAKWIQVPEPQRVRYSSIFFDFMPIAGEEYLCSRLRDIIYQLISDNRLFLYSMMELDFKHKVPLGILGRFITHSEKEHKGELSVKENGSIFIVDCVRLFILEKGIDASTTLERLDKLQEVKQFNKATVEHIKAAFETFTYLRLQNEIKLIDQGKNPSHFINPDDLTDEETAILKEAFKVASKLQDSTKRYFSKIIGR